MIDTLVVHFKGKKKRKEKKKCVDNGIMKPVPQQAYKEDVKSLPSSWGVKAEIRVRFG